MNEFQMSCPRPLQDHPRVLMGHGGGGRLMNQLIRERLIPRLTPDRTAPLHDAAVVSLGNQKIAFTTDSYVIRPIFFPGGDIGQLSVHGTVNDLSMAGARPLHLSLGLILEEGFSLQDLDTVMDSIAATAKAAGVSVVTGDTKVVDQGKGDGIYINTAGIGLIEHDLDIGPSAPRPGDAVILSGDIGRHGMAIMAVREGLSFESDITTDSAPLWDSVAGLLKEKIELRCLRDLTRGGLASACNEIAEAAQAGIRLREDMIPVREDVRAACEILGMDPLYVANEGRMIAIVPESQAAQAVNILKASSHGEGAVVVGTVVEDPDHLVTLKNPFGHDRIIDMLSADQLPRIC